MQAKYKKLVNNSIVFAVGSFGSKLVNFFLLPLYTYTLSKSDYGTTDIVQTTVNLLVPIVSLSIFDAVLRFSMDGSKNKEQVLTIGAVGTVVGSAIAIVIGLVLNYFNVENSLYLVTMLVVQIFQSLFSQYIKGIGKVRIFAFNGVFLTFSTAMFSFVLLFIFRLKMPGYFISIILATLVSDVYLFFREKLYHSISIKYFNKSLFKEMLFFSIPIIPNTIAWWATNTINKYFILFFIGASANGLFAVANKIPSLLSTINTIFFQSWQISAIEEFGSKDSEKFYSTIFNAYFKVMFLGTSLILFILKPLMRVIVADSFYHSWKYVPFLLLTVMYSSFASFFDQYYVASKKTIGVFLTTVIGTVINIVLDFLLIPTLGIEGAGISSAISFFVIWVVRVFDTKRFLITKIDYKNFVVNQFLIFVQIFLLFWLNGIVLYCSSLLVVFMVLFLNRRVVYLTIKPLLSRLLR